MTQPFTVFRRPTTKKKKYVYYAQFRDERGRRTTAVSTGKTTKAEALQWAQERFSAGARLRARCPKLTEYAENWFLWDQCQYLERKRARGEYSRLYAEEQRRKLTLHILPALGAFRLDELTQADIESWVVRTKSSSTAANANRVLVVLKIMLKEAVRRGVISVSPAESVESLPEVSAQKGTLLKGEIKNLFDDNALDSVWQSRRFHQALNALAFTTGMRMGEIQALRWGQVQEDHVVIQNSWDRKYGLKSPKANSYRVVPLTQTVSQWLASIRPVELPVTDDTFVFRGEEATRPIDHKAIVKWFYRALDAIGIDETERQERNLTFHSWRHTFHAIMRGTMSDTDLRRITGHRTERMTDHYDHVTLDLVRKVTPLIEQVLTQSDEPEARGETASSELDAS